MRNFLAVFVALAAFTATVAMVNALGGPSDVPLNFDIQDAAEQLAALIGEPLAAMAADAEVPLPGAGQTATLIGAFGLTLPAVFSFLLLGRS